MNDELITEGTTYDMVTDGTRTVLSFIEKDNPFANTFWLRLPTSLLDRIVAERATALGWQPPPASDAVPSGLLSDGGSGAGVRRNVAGADSGSGEQLPGDKQVTTADSREWLPIETAPREGSLVEGKNADEVFEWMYFSRCGDWKLLKMKGSSDTEKLFGVRKPTHWRPLPHVTSKETNYAK